MNILISGVGIAGPTLAYWLTRYGMTSTIVERAPTLRTGGYKRAERLGHCRRGLAGMRERLRQLGGELRIDSSDRGTRLHVSVPFPAR